MSKTDIPKKARNKYGYIKNTTGNNYITTQQMLATSSNGGGSGGGTIINNQVSVAIGNQIAEKTTAAKEDSYTYISSQLNSLSYVTLPQLQSMSYVSQSELSAMSYATTNDLEPVSYVTSSSTAKSNENDDFVVITQPNTVLTLPDSGVYDGQIITVINTSNTQYTLSSSSIIDNDVVSNRVDSASKTVSNTATQYVYYNGAWYQVS